MKALCLHFQTNFCFFLGFCLLPYSLLEQKSQFSSTRQSGRTAAYALTQYALSVTVLLCPFRFPPFVPSLLAYD